MFTQCFQFSRNALYRLKGFKKAKQNNSKKDNRYTIIFLQESFDKEKRHLKAYMLNQMDFS